MSKPVRKTLKFFVYFFGKLIAVAVILLAAWFVFFTAYNTANVQITVKDAFQKRASVILEPIDNSDKDLLSKVFTDKYLSRSGLAVQEENKYYRVNLFSQRTDVEFSFVFPRAEKATMEVTDVVEDIRATLVNEGAADFTPKESLMQSGRYEVTAIKTDDGTWLIDDIRLIEKVEPEIVRPLPTPAPLSEDALS